MRYFIFVFLFLLILTTSRAQNLVPNPGFESYGLCGDESKGCKFVNQFPNPPCKSSCCAGILPDRYNHNTAAFNWTSVWPYDVYNWNECTIDWYNTQSTVFNVQAYEPRSGKAHIFINSYNIWNFNGSDFRDYAQVKLTQPLTAGCQYEISLFVKLMRNHKLTWFYFSHIARFEEQVASDGMGIYLSNDSLVSTTKYNGLYTVTPQISNPAGHLLDDSMQYMKISGIFTATGGEHWLTIGNFKDNAHTMRASNSPTAGSVYLVDDIAVEEWKPELLSTSDTTLCEGDQLTLQAPSGLVDYVWSTGETSSSIVVSTAGKYWIQAKTNCDQLSDTIQVNFQEPFTAPFTLGKDTMLCSLQPTYILHAPAGYDQYTWSTGAHTLFIPVTDQGEYNVKAEYACGIDSAGIKVLEYQAPDNILTPATDTSICSNASIVLKTTETFARYLWSDGSTLDEMTVHSPGNYVVKAYTDLDCEVKDSLVIHFIYPPNAVHLGNDTSICQELGILLEVTEQPGSDILWSDGTTSAKNNIFLTGDYWVKVYNDCYEVSDTVVIEFIDCTLNISNLVTANNDNRNDAFAIRTALQRPLNVQLYNSWGTKIYENANYKDDWKAEGESGGIYYYMIYDPLLDKTYKGWLHVMK